MTGGETKNANAFLDMLTTMDTARVLGFIFIQILILINNKEKYYKELAKLKISVFVQNILISNLNSLIKNFIRFFFSGNDWIYYVMFQNSQIKIFKFSGIQEIEKKSSYFEVNQLSSHFRSFPSKMKRCLARTCSSDENI